ncbi:hypothetical protein Sulac_0552 [Sulfobacillus acidophilus DSM 10332]|uniref:Uncharacterized protein n=1 Tax=Sulfobacillus acidophilus (strain ATCC 700253 / DSM 10332 / NAL) TaxID=679936 RepID=G8TZC0_SULAD|nr:hypothetical protein Sulac_0552 [Sulfobacillus acidophilus DSM 10332]
MPGSTRRVDLNDFVKEYGQPLPENPGDITILPTRDDADELWFTQDAVDFRKWVQQEYPDVRVVQIDGSMRALHAHEVWLPLLMLGKTLGLDIFSHMLSEYLLQRLGKRHLEETIVHAKFAIEDDTALITAEFDGPASGLEGFVRELRRSPNES